MNEERLPRWLHQLARLNETIRKAGPPRGLIDLSRAAARAAQVSDATEGMHRALTRAARQATEAGSFLDPITQLLRRQELPPSFMTFVGRFAELEKHLAEMPAGLLEALGEDGLIPHPNLSLRDLERVLQAYSSTGTEAAVQCLEELHDDLFSDGTFREKLRERWERRSARGPVLLQILKAHDSGCYAPAVTAALAQSRGPIRGAALLPGPFSSKAD